MEPSVFSGFLRERGAGLFGIKEAKEIVDDGYDPRERPWYRGASSTATIHWTDVYLLAVISAQP